MRYVIKQRSLILAQGLWMLFSLVAVCYYFLLKTNPSDIDILAFCYLFVLQAVWSVWSWYAATRMPLYNPYILFLIACYLFNCGQCFLYAFGLQPQGILDGKFSLELLVKTHAFIFAAISFFHGGALFRACISKKSSFVGHWENEKSHQGVVLEGKAVFKSGLFVFLLVCIPSVYLLAKYAQTVWTSGYMGLYQMEDTATRQFAVLRESCSLLLASLLFMYAGVKNDKKLSWPVFAVIGILCCLYLFLGVRSRAVMMFLMAFWLYIQCRAKKVKEKRWLSSVAVWGIAIAFLTIFPAIWTVRNLPGSERFNLSAFAMAFANIQEHPLILSIREMGGTMQTVAYTIALVPSVRPYGFGSSYGWALMTVIPNFYFFSVHPAAAHKLADWLVWTVDPGWASLGGGLGYSIFAEAYYNFGWFGGSLIMLVFGWLIAMLCLWWWEKQDSPLRQAFVAAAFSFLLFLPRSETQNLFRPLFWYAGVLYFFATRIFLRGKRLVRRENSSRVKMVDRGVCS
mgnify:CR=1 FL=1